MISSIIYPLKHFYLWELWEFILFWLKKNSGPGQLYKHKLSKSLLIDRNYCKIGPHYLIAYRFGDFVKKVMKEKFRLNTFFKPSIWEFDFEKWIKKFVLNNDWTIH